MRRAHVPAVAPIAGARGLARLEVLLRSPEIAPVYERKLQPLAGIRWTGLGTRRVTVAGEVAMFDVADPGELQAWT